MYRGLKAEFLHYYGLEDWMMHLVLGAAFYVMALAATRRPWLSLWLLIGLQLGNELLDLSEQGGRPRLDLRQTVTDSVWTLAVPAMAAALVATCQAVWDMLPRPRRARGRV